MNPNYLYEMVRQQPLRSDLYDPVGVPQTMGGMIAMENARNYAPSQFNFTPQMAQSFDQSAAQGQNDLAKWEDNLRQRNIENQKLTLQAMQVMKPELVQTEQGMFSIDPRNAIARPVTSGESGNRPFGAKIDPIEKARQTAGYQAGLKDLAKDDAQVASANALEQAYKRWQELNAKTMTGPIAGRRPISFDPDYQEMKQIESYLAVNNFKPGQGQISNFERGLIKGAGPSLTNDELTNQNITNIGLGAVQNMKDRANFRELYLQQKGNLLGSDKAWQDYLDSNPRFIKDQLGRVIPNENRQDWMAYFSGSGQQGGNKNPYGTSAPGNNTVTLPDGRTVTFPNASSAEAFRRKAGL